MQKQDIDKIIKDNPDSKEIYVTVEAVITLQRSTRSTVVQDESLPQLTVYYPITNIALHAHKDSYWFTDSLSLFIAWLTIPFLIATGLTYYLLKYCMAKIARRQKDMVEESEIGGASQTNPTANKLTDTQQPESAAGMNKTHI